MMKKPESHLDDLKEIRNLMERSSRFISLSGLSGVSAGVCGLLGALAANLYMQSEGIRQSFVKRGPFVPLDAESAQRVITNLALIGVVTLALAVGSAFFFSYRKAKAKGLAMWDKTSKRLMINILIPLVAGGIFCIALIYHGEYGLVAPATLIFYGLALVNGSKYTLDEIRSLGYIQVFLGLMASFFVGSGLGYWAQGFGLFHIIYGLFMWYRYDRKK